MTKPASPPAVHPLLAAGEFGEPECPAAVTVRLHGPAVVVAVGGDLDASNADDVSAYVHRFVPHGPALVLDITDVGFLGVQGLRAVIGLVEECRRTGVACAVVASQSAVRLLRTVYRREVLPFAASVTEAVQQRGGHD